jgi:hypothetical protein
MSSTVTILTFGNPKTEDNVNNQSFVFRHGRIWFGSLAERFQFEPSTFLVHETILKQAPLLKEQFICIEYSLYKIGHEFGILGCHYVPDTSGRLHIRVGYNAIPDDENILKHLGIPQNYAEEVLQESILTANEVDFLGSGNLVFDSPFYHRLYSVPRMYRTLARALIYFLNPSEREITSEVIDSILHKAVSQVYKKW